MKPGYCLKIEKAHPVSPTQALATRNQSSKFSFTSRKYRQPPNPTDSSPQLIVPGLVNSRIEHSYHCGKALITHSRARKQVRNPGITRRFGYIRFNPLDIV